MSGIVVIDYGMGNLRSVQRALEHLSEKDVLVSGDPDVIRHAKRIVFPGQGAIGDCMAELKRLHLHELIPELVREKPFFGICMGMQVLMEYSEENDGTAGIGLFPGSVKRFPDGQLDQEGSRLKIPHMGWNQVNQTHHHVMWQGIADQSRFYFVHSYYVVPGEEETIVGSTTHGLEFASVLAKDNVFATQFHPEKSQTVGLKLLQNFINWQI